MPECWLYKAFHLLQPTDKLLYVGISESPSDRMAQHGRDKWWWRLVDRIEWTKLDCRERAASLETRLIAEQQPLFNKHQSTLTAGALLFECLGLLQHTFAHCPLCQSACRYSMVQWEAKFLCTVDIGEDFESRCFEVRMKCDANHSPVEWTQFIPIDVLSACQTTQMPEAVLDDLWGTACSNGEVGEDIPHLRPPTLDVLVCGEKSRDSQPGQLLIEAS